MVLTRSIFRKGLNRFKVFAHKLTHKTQTSAFNKNLTHKIAELNSVAIERQHAKGKLSARERIELLLDDNTFIEVGQFVGGHIDDENFKGTGVITGYGKVNGKKIFVYAQDFSVQGGSLGSLEGQKICNIIDRAYIERKPIIALLDSGGARIQQGVEALGYYGKIFEKTVKAQGVIPQLSLILGPCAGGAVYCPALTDFIIMTKENSHMFVTGPDVVTQVTGEKITADDLGGGRMHSEISGVSHFLADDEFQALSFTKAILSFLPSNSEENLPVYHYEEKAEDEINAEKLETIIPDSEKQGYDVSDVIYNLVDNEEFLEVRANFAKSAVVGMARIDGKTVGIVANQPNHNSGTLDMNASVKISDFVNFCSSYKIPVVSLVDVPGYLPGGDQERGGIIRIGSKVISAYAACKSKVITVIMRKAYGGAYIVMGSKELGADYNFAWPKAQIAVLGAAGAVEIIHRKELKAAKDKDKLRQELIDKYTDETINSKLSQKLGSIDALISPRDTRKYIASVL